MQLTDKIKKRKLSHAEAVQEYKKEIEKHKGIFRKNEYGVEFGEGCDELINFLMEHLIG